MCVRSLFDQHYAAAEAFLAARNWTAAERELEAALAIDPADAGALARMSHCQMKLGRTERAEEITGELIAADPNSADGHRLRAVQQLNARAPRSAMASAVEAVRLDPLEAYNHHVLAAAHAQRRAWPRAFKAATRSRELSPHWPVAMAQQAATILEIKGGAAAQPFIDDALAAGGLDDEYVLMQAGAVALARGRLEDARNFLGELLRRNAEHEDALSLFLLTDRRRHRLLRWNYRRRYWRRENSPWNWIAWGGGWVLLIAVLTPVVVISNVPGFALGLAWGVYQQIRYRAHRKEVKDHFRRTALRTGY